MFLRKKRLLKLYLHRWLEVQSDLRIGLSTRLGVGLGLVYALLFAACLMNMSDIFFAMQVAGVLLGTLVSTGYVWIYYREDIFDLLVE